MIDPTRRNIIIVGVAAAVLVVGVMAVVIIRGRGGVVEEASPTTGAATTNGSTTTQTGQPSVTGQPTVAGNGGAEDGVVVPPGAPSGSSYRVEGKVEDTVDPQLIGTTQTFTPAELKAMGLPSDIVVHYKWVLPPEGAQYTAPMRLILDLPERPSKDVVMPEKKVK